MILTKDEIERLAIVSNLIGPSQLQPAGVDLTVREVFALEGEGALDFDNSERRLSETRRLEFDSKGWLHLPKGAYKITYNEVVKIPDDVLALAFPRSSLTRCGASVLCAVWDPGYHGRSESLLVVYNERGIRLKKNARVVQMIFLRLTNHAPETYKGRYHGENL